MKKTLLLAVAACCISLSGYSQCTPDGSITKPGISPDSATNLPHAIVGVPYSTVMQVRAPQDTSTVLFGQTFAVTIDTIILLSMSGFPPGGYTYSCNPNAGCYFLGNSNGCVYISGPAPQISQVGMKYYLTAIVKTSAHVPLLSNLRVNQYDTLRYYFIQVDNGSGISVPNSSNFAVTQNHPNPFNKSTLIEFYSPSGGMISLTVSNMLGKRVSAKSIWVQQGNNKITLSAKDFDPGIYFYTIATEKQSVTRRMIVGNE